MENKDTLPVAPQGTPTSQPQVPPQAGDTTAQPSAPASDTAPRKYAGKYDSVEELESAYQNASSKIGQKTYIEKLGAKVIEKTGYSVAELETAGYSPDEITEMMFANDTPAGVSDETPPPKPTPSKKESKQDSVRERVEAARLASLEWRQQLFEYVSENPEAKAFQSELNDFHSMQQYKDFSPAQLFNEKLKKFMQKGEQNLQARHTEKERAGINVSNTPVPEVSRTADLAKTIKERRGKVPLALAAEFVRESFKPKK